MASGRESSSLLEQGKVKFSLDNIRTSASKFVIRDIEALRIDFQSAKESQVIPNIRANLPADFPKEYILPDINSSLFATPGFSTDKIEPKNPDIQTFVFKLCKVVKKPLSVVGEDEGATDTLLDNLLRIVGLDRWPLTIRNHHMCRLFIYGKPHMFANPEFVIMKRDWAAMVAVEDKHLKNVSSLRNFGETQIAADILACGYENIRDVSVRRAQTIYAIRVISSFVTFYKATIPRLYWDELDKGLMPNQSVVIRRWPGENTLESGLDLAEPDGRQKVLEALIKIREAL